MQENNSQQFGIGAGGQDSPQKLGERIASLRRGAGMTQAQLAEQLGISAQAVSKWESGLSCPDITLLIPLSELLGVSIDELLRGTNKDPSQPPQGDKAQADGENAAEAGGAAEATASLQQEIHSLDISLGAAEVELLEGDEFALDLEGYRPGECNSSVESGLWAIKEQASFPFNLRWFKGRRVRVTFPRGMAFQRVALSVKAGKLTGTGLAAQASCLEVGAAEMVLKRFDSRDAIVNVGVGSIQLEGKLTGSCKMNCGVGSIEADLEALDEYGYEVDTGLGTVLIGPDRFSGIGGHQGKTTASDNYFAISCQVGEVKVKFHS